MKYALQIFSFEDQHRFVEFKGMCVEKEMATHSSIHACKIPWTEEPEGLKYVGSQKVGHY